MNDQIYMYIYIYIYIYIYNFFLGGGGGVGNGAPYVAVFDNLHSIIFINLFHLM